MTRIGWHVKLGATLTLAVMTAAVVTVLLLVSGPSDAASSTASRRALALREANRLLAAGRLPGAVTATSSGSEAGDAVAGLDRAVGPDTVERSGSWTVPRSVAAVRSLLDAHPPPGTRLSRDGSLTFVAIHSGRGLADASLAFTVLATGPRTSTVHAEVLVRWLVARSRAERVPPNAGALEITRGPQGQAPSLVIRVTAPGLIARIRTLLDRLPLVQPGPVYHCPAQFPQVPVVRFIFRTGGSGRAGGDRILAAATEPADVRSPTTACDAMRFIVAGRALTPLLGGYRLLREVSELLGRRLWTAPYAA